METNSSFLAKEMVTRVVTTNVANRYLASVLEPHRDEAPDSIEAFRTQVNEACFLAAATVDGVINQLGDCADRIVLSRAGGIAFIFLGGSKYAMIECDDEGSRVALLSDRSRDIEAETWLVEPGGLTLAVRKIRSFLGSPHGTQP